MECSSFIADRLLLQINNLFDDLNEQHFCLHWNESNKHGSPELNIFSGRTIWNIRRKITATTYTRCTYHCWSFYLPVFPLSSPFSPRLQLKNVESNINKAHNCYLPTTCAIHSICNIRMLMYNWRKGCSRWHRCPHFVRSLLPIKFQRLTGNPIQYYVYVGERSVLSSVAATAKSSIISR